MTAAFHIAFNVVLAAMLIGLLDPLAWLLVTAFPKSRRSGDLSAPRHLDESALETPSLALANAAHLARLREGRLESMETTSLHLDVLRDLKRIHSHVCSVAYPVLEAAGELSDATTSNRDEISLP